MRHLHVLWLTTALAAAGLTIVPMPGLVPVARAESVAPVTNYEVLLRMLGEKFPETATKIREKFEKIDKSNKTPEEKKVAKSAELEKQTDKLGGMVGLSSTEGKAAIKEAKLILVVINRLVLMDQLNATALPEGFTIRGTDYDWKTFLPNYQTTRAALEDQRKREAELNKQDGGIAPEHSRADTGTPEIFVSFGGSVGERQPAKQAFLAKEIGGVLTLGAIQDDRDVTETGFDVALRYAGEFSGFRIASGAKTVIEPYFSYSSGLSRQFTGLFDPGAGVGLGIPGTGDLASLFPAGVFLPDFPGPGNDVSDIRSRYEFDSYRAGLRVGQEFDLSPGFSVQPSLGIAYLHTAERQNFGGSVVGYGLDFGYDTRIKLDTVKVEFGGRLEHSLGGSFSVYAAPYASLNFVGVKGRDGLELSGIVTDSQRVNLDGNKTLPGVRLEAGFDWEPEDSPVSFYFGARVAHEPDTATVHRSGEIGEQSEAKVKYSTSYGLNASVSFRF